jgi:spermidine/putrescine transport system substrate-binding protein
MDESYLRELARLEMSRTSRRIFLKRMGLGGAMAIGGSTLLAACGESGSRSTATTGADGEIGGTLQFVGVDGEDGKAIAEPWLKEHDVTLKAAYIADNDTMLTRLRTGGTRNFDVLTLTKDGAPKEIQLGYVRELDLDRLPDFEGIFPAFDTAPWVTVDGKTYGFPLVWGSEPCVFDPKVWKEMPPSYTDFADKRFRGALTTIDEPYGNQWLVAKSLGFGENGESNRITQAELDQVRDAWIEIKKNVKSFSAAFGDQTDLLVRGEATIALNSWQAVVAFAAEKGKDLAYGVPANDGTYYWGDSYYITSEAPNAATAYAYVAYMTKPENNAKLATELQSAPASPAARDLLDKDSVSAGYDFSVVDTSDNSEFVKSILPPDADEGDIVGKEAWIKSWQEVKSS